ncbi:tetratricopeptide repeat protein [Formosa sp. S-31]|uniref:tetratricopeptide repeat protein n=1 Tax=Formosa sp. S-31 TaxID=2790949 RepID=UPI003EB9DBA3
MRLFSWSILIQCIFFCECLYAQAAVVEAQNHFKAKEFSRVVAVLNPYLKQQSADLEGLELIADAYAHLELWDEAIPKYRELVDLQPKQAIFQYKYGGALAMKALTVSKWEALPLVLEAKTAFLNATNLDVNHIDARWALVKIYTKLPFILGGSTSKALRYADELETLSEVDGCLAKGYIFDEQHNFEEAEFYFKKAVQIGGSETCYRELANLYIRAGKKEKAKAVLQTGLRTLKSEALQNMLDDISQ